MTICQKLALYAAMWSLGLKAYHRDLDGYFRLLEDEYLPNAMKLGIKEQSSILASFIKKAYSTCNLKSKFFLNEWNALLKAIPIELINSAAIDFPSYSAGLASELTTVCLECMTSKKEQIELMDFAMKNGLTFDKPTPKKEKTF